MAENSNIEWTTHTFNPWIGCTHVSPGCKFCYAETLMDKRYGKVEWGKGKPRLRTSAANWRLPLKWNRGAEKSGTRPRVFCASLADVFDEEAPELWRGELFNLIGQTPNLDWLILTKRPQNITPMMQSLDRGHRYFELQENVWLGTSVENQQTADERIPELLKIPAAVRFLSCEPLLGEVDLNEYLGCGWDGEGGWRNCPQHLSGKIDCSGVDWVIVGGESGPNARPMHPDWVRSLRDQCQAANVPFLFKQWGEWLPGSHVGDKFTDAQLSNIKCHLFEGAGFFASFKVGKKAAGRLLDNWEWNEFPEVAEVPA